MQRKKGEKRKKATKFAIAVLASCRAHLRASFRLNTVLMRAFLYVQYRWPVLYMRATGYPCVLMRAFLYVQYRWPVLYMRATGYPCGIETF